MYAFLEKNAKKKLICLHHANSQQLMFTVDALLRKISPKKICRIADKERLFTLLGELELFSEPTLYLYTPIKPVTKKEIEDLEKILSESVQLVIASTHKAVSSTCVYDLTLEKPWETKKRLIQYFIDEAFSLGKQLSHDAAQYLADIHQSDPFLMHQEFEQMICLSHESTSIDRSFLLKHSRSSSLWEAAEILLWSNSFPKINEDPFALFSVLRYLITLSFDCVQKKETSLVLSKLSPKRREYYKNKAVTRPLSFYIKTIQELFALEILAKSKTISSKALLEHLYVTCSYQS